MGLFFSYQYDFKIMKKCNKTTKFLRRQVISTPLNLTEVKKYAKLYLNEEQMIFVNHN